MSDDSTPPPPATKLLISKERWAREGKFLTGRVDRRGERLPPGQHLVRDWPVLDLGVHPKIDRTEWRLTVEGAIEDPATWDWAGFSALDQVSAVSDIHCVTTWSRYDNRWQGVSTRALLALVRPRDDARHVLLHAYDGYTTNLPLEDFAAADALLAHSWDGKPLTREHGAPVRLIVPHLYFWKSAKWIRKIEIVAEDDPGFWEVRGYHNYGDPWREQRYSDDED
jgi:DMSO/TMAO reductase YedYZ molybdopterin-dependent catalytic subunit